MMKSWLDDIVRPGITNDESFISYLTRVHTRFEDIHPFRDGNGRMGRIIMNILLLQNHYHVLVVPSPISPLFNAGIEQHINGDPSLFERLLAETLFGILTSYEEVLGVPLLPSEWKIIDLPSCGFILRNSTRPTWHSTFGIIPGF